MIKEKALTPLFGLMIILVMLLLSSINYNRSKELFKEQAELIKANHQQVLILIAGKEEAKAEILASFKKAKFNRDPNNVTEEAK